MVPPLGSAVMALFTQVVSSVAPSTAQPKALRSMMGRPAKAVLVEFDACKDPLGVEGEAPLEPQAPQVGSALAPPETKHWPLVPVAALATGFDPSPMSTPCAVLAGRTRPPLSVASPVEAIMATSAFDPFWQCVPPSPPSVSTALPEPTELTSVSGAAPKIPWKM